jgi:hypothetical protein
MLVVLSIGPAGSLNVRFVLKILVFENRVFFIVLHK